LQKIAPVSWSVTPIDDVDSKSEACADEDTEELLTESLSKSNVDNAQPLSKPKRKSKEEPFLPFPLSMLSDFENLREFYGITKEFPISQLMIRSQKSPKIYYISEAVRDLLEADQEKGLLQIVNSGLKLFNKHDVKQIGCPYRICQEGLPWLFPFITKRIVEITEKDFVNLLSNKDPFLHTFSKETRDSLEPLEQGCLVFKLKASSKPWAGLAASGWRGKVSCHLLIPKAEVLALQKFLLPITQNQLVAKGQSEKQESVEGQSEKQEVL